jgi:histidinol phosphatase-like enzyme
MYFATDENQIYERFDGERVAVQGEGNTQTGLNQEGEVVPVTTNQNGLALNTETRIYTNQITSYVNALYRSNLVKTDLFLYPNTPSTERGPVNFDAFKRSLKEFTVEKDNVKIKIYYSKIR